MAVENIPIDISGPSGHFGVKPDMAARASTAVATIVDPAKTPIVSAMPCHGRQYKQKHASVPTIPTAAAARAYRRRPRWMRGATISRTIDAPSVATELTPAIAADSSVSAGLATGGAEPLRTSLSRRCAFNATIVAVIDNEANSATRTASLARPNFRSATEPGMSNADGLGQPFHVAFPAGVGDGDGVSTRQRLEDHGEFRLPRHRRILDQHRDHGDSAFERGGDLAGHDIVGLVETSLPVRPSGREPAGTDHDDRCVGRGEAALDRLDEVGASVDVVDVTKDAVRAEVGRQTVVQPSGNAAYVGTPIADEDPTVVLASHGRDARANCSVVDSCSTSVLVVFGENYEVAVSAGNLRPPAGEGLVMPHRWTTEGVVIDASFTGAHLLHLAAAGCLLNDVYREAERLGVRVDGARVRASGGFDPASWSSTGISYEIDVVSGASDVELDRLLRAVDEVAEIPRALRVGTSVTRAPMR